jgi:hypothetical protein
MPESVAGVDHTPPRYALYAYVCAVAVVYTSICNAYAALRIIFDGGVIRKLAKSPYVGVYIHTTPGVGIMAAAGFIRPATVHVPVYVVPIITPALVYSPSVNCPDVLSRTRSDMSISNSRAAGIAYLITAPANPLG